MESKELGKRYRIESKYDRDEDMLTIIFKDDFKGQTRIVRKKLNGLDRTRLEENIYKSMGILDLVIIDAIKEMRVAGVGNYANFSEERRVA